MRLRVASRMPGLGLRCRVPRLGDMSDLHVWMLARHSKIALSPRIQIYSLSSLWGERRGRKTPPCRPPCADDTNDTKITLHSQGPLLEPPRVQHYRQTIPRQTSFPKVHFWNLPCVCACVCSLLSLSIHSSCIGPVTIAINAHDGSFREKGRPCQSYGSGHQSQTDEDKFTKSRCESCGHQTQTGDEDKFTKSRC